MWQTKINPKSDVSISVDLVNLPYKSKFDVAIIFSEDSDLGPGVETAREIAAGQGRTVSFESVSPYDEERFRVLRRRFKAIPGAEQVKLSKGTYDACLDATDYRNPSK